MKVHLRRRCGWNYFHHADYAFQTGWEALTFQSLLSLLYETMSFVTSMHLLASIIPSTFPLNSIFVPCASF